MVGIANTPTSLAAGPSADEGDHAVPTDEFPVVELDPDAPAYIVRDPRAPARGEGDGMNLVEGGAPDGGDLLEVEMVVEEKLMTVAEGRQGGKLGLSGGRPGARPRCRDRIAYG
jgi:hypothetical protein